MRNVRLTWSGTETEYGRYHHQLRKLKGSARHCERCGATDPATQYHWANLTGDYSNLDDYQCMCAGCHRKYDLARHREGALSAAEAAARIGTSHPQLCRLIREGQIKAERINPKTKSVWRVDEQSVADYIARRAA